LLSFAHKNSQNDRLGKLSSDWRILCTAAGLQSVQCKLDFIYENDATKKANGYSAYASSALRLLSDIALWCCS
jgi:hypothetical protein